MEHYITPIKDICTAKNTLRNSTRCRNGDWICINCNNLNFSFRKKCNRCKIQTRQQNQITTAMYLTSSGCSNLSMHPTTPINQNSSVYSSYYCYPELYSQPLQQQPMGVQYQAITPLKDKTPKKNIRQLPSVSPLLKKYHARENYQTAINWHPCQQESSIRTGLFTSNQVCQDSLWQVRDFQQIIISNKSTMEHQQDHNQMEFLMQQIIL